MLIIIFHQYVPQDITDLTIQQMEVQQFLAVVIKLILIIQTLKLTNKTFTTTHKKKHCMSTLILMKLSKFMITWAKSL